MLFGTKLLHTVIWAVMASAIVALPVLALTNHFGWALAITVLIAGEGITLGLSGGACPLTAIARRYTDDPSPAFDIFLPQWVAKWNKQLFGSLFVVGEVLVLLCLARSDSEFLRLYVGVLVAGVVATALAFGVHARRSQS